MIEFKSDCRETRSPTEIDDLHNRTLVEEAIAGIAHQIHQPLYTISNYARACQRILKKTHVDDDLLAMLDGISRAVVRSRDIIQQLRVIAHHQESVRVRVSMEPIVQCAISAMKEEVDDSHGKIEILESQSEDVLIDPTQIRHVVMILLRNAIESMLSQPIDQRIISIQTSLFDNFIAVCIKDRGRGLTFNSNQNIFDAFVTDKPRRLGMGLAIGRSIVENHGGRIWYNKNEEHGMAFSFRIPMVQAE